MDEAMNELDAYEKEHARLKKAEWAKAERVRKAELLVLKAADKIIAKTHVIGWFDSPHLMIPLARAVRALRKLEKRGLP